MAKFEKKKVFVGMSGGVDSSVAAALLLEQGHDVTGIFLKFWSEELERQVDFAFEGECPWEQDLRDAKRVAARLGIPLHVVDVEKEYRKYVVDYFIDGYADGITPNPDIMCNQKIKFGEFLNFALDNGADAVATGHYARVKKGRKGYQLLKGLDDNKDQTYFLYALNQKQLSHTMFPIGDYAKPKIRKMAERMDLPVSEKPDSQGICFLGEIDLVQFLKTQIKHKKGKVVNTRGEELGEHEGLYFFTIGQRKGIGIPGSSPYYVVDRDFKTNTLIVTDDENDPGLYSSELMAKNISWTLADKPKFPLKADVKIRYRQESQKATIEESGGKLKVTFKKPQRAITSGQAIVIYKKDQVLGGGTII